MTERLKIILASCLSVVVLILIGIYSIVSTGSYKSASDWVTHTHIVISSADSLLSEIQDIETAQRGFVVTDDEKYLAPYNDGLKKIGTTFANLKHLTIDNPEQQALLDTINKAITPKVEFAKKVIEVRKQIGFQAAEKLMVKGTGEELMRNLRSLLNRFNNNENILRSKRFKTAKTDFSRAIKIIAGSILLAIAIVLITLYFYLKDHAKRIASEKMVIASEARLKNFLNSMPIGVFIVAANGKPYYANSKAKDILGKGIIPNITVNEFPEVYKAFIAGTNDPYPTNKLSIARALKGEKNILVDDLEVLKDTTRVPLRINTTYITDNEDNIEFAIAVIEDITLIKAAEKELTDANERFFRIFDNNPVGMVISDNETGQFQYANEAFCNALCYTREDIIGKTSLEIKLIEPNSREAMLEQLAKYGYVNDFEVEVIRKNGEKVWNLSSVKIIKIHNKDYSLTSFSDISERIKIEGELKRALRLAEESSVLKETFLANMSHEIRTPMNSILGFTNLLLKRDLPAADNEKLQIIKASGEALLRIINDILDVSKIESGMMTFEEHPISIKEIFASLSAMLYAKAEEKDLKLSFEYESSLPDTMLGDPTRLTQIILNLVGNAIKFTDRGGKIDVFAKRLSTHDGIYIIEFSVKDTGIGIAEDQLNHIFERFRQAESTTTRKYGGTGLGLSIAKQMVTLQGGQLNVKSVVGVGSEFSFTLPFKQTEKVQRDLRKQKQEFNVAALKRISILVVEDNPINVKFILSVFAEYDIKPDLANNGKEAVEKVRDKKYEIVLMDIEMPEMNGYEATEVIRNELKSNVPIIAMTAHAMAGEKEKCIRLGMNDYISKPIDTDSLFEKIYMATIAKEAKITNLTFLIRSMRGKKEAIHETINIFLSQIPEELSDINESISKGDYMSVKRSAHRAKSTVSLMGITAMEKILEEMELLAATEKGIEKIVTLGHSLNLLSKQAIEEIQIEKLNYS